MSTNAKVTIGIVVALLVATVIGGLAYGMPQYNVYRQQLAGEARLREAESSRKIAVLEAQAAKDSALMLSEAEIIRAEGTAKANKILGDSLKDNEAYLRYLWISYLEKGNNAVIYVPTETGLPILEAGKRQE